MSKLNIEQLYKDAHALLKGHFLLSSGNHSDTYLQSARVLENPKNAQILANALAEQIRSYNLQIDCICSPALGGIIAGYELARALGVRFIFTERVDGKMTLRRGFEVKENENVTIVSHAGKAFQVEPPITVELLVTECEPGEKGNTAQGATKPCTVETGAQVMVPLFVNEGDTLKIDTRTGEYSSRV